MCVSLRPLLWIVALATFACGSAHAVVVNVPADAPTIQAALNIADVGDEIVVAPGTYREQISFNGRDVILRSSAGPEVTFISGDINGDGSADVGPLVNFEFEETNAAVLEGFTLIDGTDGGNGVPAGISILFSSPTIRNVVVRSNFSDGASAVGVDFASPVFDGVRFIDNNSPGGAGALSISTTGTTTIRNCLFGGNFADGGTGAISIGGTPVVNIVNSIFSGNRANGGTAAISISSRPNVTIANCTFSENTIVGGARLNIGVSSTATVLITNSIFRATGTGGVLAGSALALTVRNSNVIGGFAAGTNILNADPLFVDADGADGLIGTDDDDLRLTAGSPSIDAGASADVPPGITTDAGGGARIVGTVDHGAFEAQEAPDCPADFNSSGAATVQDIFDFLAAYFAGDPTADFNGSGSTTVQDIFDFLAAYFTGC